MKNSVKFIIGLGVVVVVVGIYAFANNSVGVQAQTGCSLETLNGDYIYSYDGYEVTDAGNVPFAYSGRENYDGAGGMSGVYSGEDSFGVTRFQEYEGEYVVFEDCRGILTTDPGTELELNFDIYVDESTGDFYFTGVDGGSITQGHNRKVQN